MKKLLPLLFLIGAVVVSGCVGQSEEKPGAANGLIISTFSSDAKSIPAGDSIELFLEVENVGGAVAENAKVDLSGVIFGTTGLDWNCRDETTDVALARKLLPPERGIPGDTDFTSWVCKSPKDIRSDTPYTFDVRVTYDYSTDITGKLNFVAEDYWSTLSQDEKDQLAGGVSYLSQTPGPLSIKLYSGSRTRPFVIYEDEENEAQTLRITITNVGKGKPVNYEITMENIGISQGATITNCDENPITLSRGDTASVSCDVELQNPENVINRQDFTVSLSFKYEWYVDSSTDVTVEKPLT